jgi:hypothetical protein
MRITPVGKQDDPFPNIPKKEVKEASLSKTAALDPLVLVNSSDKMIDKLNELVTALSGEAQRIRQVVATAKEHGLGDSLTAQEEIKNLISPLRAVERMAGIFIQNIESLELPPGHSMTPFWKSKSSPAYPETEEASEYLGE